jgi:hypothetical protein
MTSSSLMLILGCLYLPEYHWHFVPIQIPTTPMGRKRRRVWAAVVLPASVSQGKLLFTTSWSMILWTNYSANLFCTRLRCTEFKYAEGTDFETRTLCDARSNSFILLVFTKIKLHCILGSVMLVNWVVFCS